MILSNFFYRKSISSSCNRRFINSSIRGRNLRRKCRFGRVLRVVSTVTLTVDRDWFGVINTKSILHLQPTCQILWFSKTTCSYESNFSYLNFILQRILLQTFPSSDYVVGSQNRLKSMDILPLWAHLCCQWKIIFYGLIWPQQGSSLLFRQINLFQFQF